MRVILGIKRIGRLKKAVVALGVFDGVHLAHKRILMSAKKKAKSIGGVSVAFTFWPHPGKEVNIYSLEHRLRIIGSLGIDVCVVARLSRHLSHMEPEAFVRDILVNKLGAGYLYVGKNFRFGHRAAGDVRLLERLADVYNFRLKVFEVLRVGGMRVSSTCIRRLIRRGKLYEAERLLGRRVNVMGTVIKGISLAKRLGFPTANISPYHEVIPPPGVYAVEVIWKNKKLSGVCNIGSRPTFNAKAARHVEVHIFNFKGNLYGRNLEVQFLKRIRRERKFGSAASLITQIKKDIIAAKKYFPSINLHHNICLLATFLSTSYCVVSG